MPGTSAELISAELKEVVEDGFVDFPIYVEFENWWRLSPFSKALFTKKMKMAAFSAWAASAERLRSRGIVLDDLNKIVEKIIKANEVSYEQRQTVRQEERNRLQNEVMTMLNTRAPGEDRWGHGFKDACNALLALLGDSDGVEVKELSDALVPPESDPISPGPFFETIQVGGKTLKQREEEREAAIQKGDLVPGTPSPL